MRHLSVISIFTIGIVGTSSFLPGSASGGLRGDYFNDFTRPGGIITFDPGDLYMTRVDSLIDFWNACDCNYAWQTSNWYGVRWTGHLRIDEAGEYGFGTVCDDGSQVWLNGELIVDNGEEQWFDWEDSINEGSYTGLYPEGYGRPDSLPGPIHLTTGYHAIEVRFYDAAAYDGIEFWWLKPGSGPSDIPFYGISCYSGGINLNPATNWEIVPSDVLTDALTSVHEPTPPMPVVLHTAVPNPFNPRTVICYALSSPASVELKIYDLAGRLVRILVSGETLAAGRYEATWSGQDDTDRSMPAGIYFCKLAIPDFAVTKRLTLTR
jgi:hypothetical protein